MLEFFTFVFVVINFWFGFFILWGGTDYFKQIRKERNLNEVESKNERTRKLLKAMFDEENESLMFASPQKNRYDSFDGKSGKVFIDAVEYNIKKIHFTGITAFTFMFWTRASMLDAIYRSAYNILNNPNEKNRWLEKTQKEIECDSRREKMETKFKEMCEILEERKEARRQIGTHIFSYTPQIDLNSISLPGVYRFKIKDNFTWFYEVVECEVILENDNIHEKTSIQIENMVYDKMDEIFNDLEKFHSYTLTTARFHREYNY